MKTLTHGLETTLINNFLNYAIFLTGLILLLLIGDVALANTDLSQIKAVKNTISFLDSTANVVTAIAFSIAGLLLIGTVVTNYFTQSRINWMMVFSAAGILILIGALPQLGTFIQSWS